MGQALIGVSAHGGIDQAGAQPHRAVAQAGEAGIVGDQHQGGAAVALEGEEQVDDLGAGRLVEVAVGSSATRIAGSGATARAMATRCCSPPESWAG